MSQLFRRKPIAALLVDEADSKHALKRVLGAGDLVMLSIGAVIGAGIFGAIGTAAAGQIAPDGTVVRLPRWRACFRHCRTQSLRLPSRYPEALIRTRMRRSASWWRGSSAGI